jgi:hypothetical protein
MDMPIGGLAISPYFATDRQILVQVKGGELFLCRDHGDRFEAVPSESAGLGYEFSQIISRESAPFMKFSPNYDKDKTLYAALMHQLVKSTDGGRSWVKIPKPPIRYESEASLMKEFFLPIVLEGQWKKDHSKEFSASGIIHSDEPGSEVTLRFVGTGVKWIGTHGPDRGVASVFIDGTFQKKADQYSGDRKVLVESFSKTGLPYGSHMITIKVDGLRNENSSGSSIYIDAFDVIR